MRAPLFASFLAVLVPALPPAAARAAVKPGLAGAQELFRQNRWEEARVHLRSQWGALPAHDRPGATFLIGRSYVRDAGFYRAVRGFEAEVGLEYLRELGSVKANRRVAWIPLFRGLYQVEAGQDAEAEPTLLAASRSSLPAEWRETARLRRALALHRLGRVQAAAAALAAPTPEGRFCRLVATGAAEPPSALPKDSRTEKLLTAAVLFRANRAAHAEALLSGLKLDLPDVEDNSDPKKVLRFHDPVLVAAWERICWERAVVALKPLAAGGTGIEQALAGYYVGLGLYHLGVADESVSFVKQASASSLGPELQPTARLLLASSSWREHLPGAPELLSLWTSTEAQPDAVLFWDGLSRGARATTEPFATRLDARLRDLLRSSPDRPSGALVGTWGLARLRRGDDPTALVAALSEHRDKSNKNKLEWNDPLLLLALSAAYYRDQEYAQALETLFEVSKTFDGLRALQWNLQGIYAARQKAGGEARISQ